MKKVKVLFTSVISAIVCLHLVGYFNVINIYAAETLDQDVDQTSPLQFTNDPTNPSDAQEEGAAGNLDNQNIEPGLPEGQIDDQPSSLNQMPQVGPGSLGGSAPQGMTMLSVPEVATALPDVVINEFLPNPLGINTDNNNEWVELYNNENQAVDISNWNLGDSYDSTRSVIPANTQIDAHGFYLYHISGNYLNNSSPDTVNLSDSNLVPVDSYSYSVTHDGESYGRYPDGTNNWHELSFPTPGSANYLRPLSGTINDGLTIGQDIDYSNDATSLSANWAGFSDPLFPIDYYEYAFGTTTGSTDITGGWLTTDESNVTYPCSLTEDQTYYASVRAVNSQGIKSDIVSSDGVTIDLTAPINYDYSIVSPDGSPITVGSEVYLEIQPGEADLTIDGTFNGKHLTWLTDIDQLKHGPFYYAVYTVEANDLQTKDALLEFTLTDQAGNTSQVYQYNSGVEIDTVAPLSPGSVSVISGSSSIQINWSASLSEDTVGYNIYRSSSPYIKLNSVLLPASQFSYTDEDVEDGVTYHYKITAVDLAGNETLLADAATSQAIEITAISKVVGRISDVGVKTYQTASVSSSTESNGKVEGEKAVKTNTETGSDKNEQQDDVTNWPLIVALIVAGLIVLSGVWYYWVVTRNIEQDVTQVKRTVRPRRRRSARTKTTSRLSRSKRSRPARHRKP